jgi:hypothetical protein
VYKKAAKIVLALSSEQIAVEIEQKRLFKVINDVQDV